MKLRKEYLILGVIIISLSLYLALRKSDRSLYELPTLEPVALSEISKISIMSAKGTFDFTQKAGKWVINEAAYPADENNVKQMAEAIGDLTLSTLVSESKNYERYHLDSENKIAVKAWKSGTLFREFDIGKGASGHRHTFVKIAGDHRVYHANKNFRGRFDKDLDDFRDKKVMVFDEDRINRIVLISENQALEFKKETAVEGPESTLEEGDSAKPKDGKPVWKNDAGEVIDDSRLNRIVSNMANLICKGYVYDKKKEDLKDPSFVVKLYGDEEHTLSIFKPSKKGALDYPSVSSQCEYPFMYNRRSVNNIMLAIEYLAPENNKKEGDGQKSDAN